VAGFDAQTLKAAGFSSSELKEACFNASGLKATGFNLSELMKAGFNASGTLRRWRIASCDRGADAVRLGALFRATFLRPRVSGLVSLFSLKSNVTKYLVFNFEVFVFSCTGFALCSVGAHRELKSPRWPHSYIFSFDVFALF
jgi:hypothetical protein